MSTYQHISADRLDSASFSSARSTQQLTLWMGNTEKNLIRAIAIQTVGIEIILNVQIAEIERLDLTVQVTPETVRVRGNWKTSAQVEGFFCPEPFESLIPLPCAVFPEATTAKRHDRGLIIHLARQLEDDIAIVQLDLTNQHWAIPSSSF